VSSEKAGHETAKIVYRTEHLDHIFMLGFVGVCVAVVVGTVTMHSIQLCRRERAIGRSIPMHIFFLLSILPYGGTTNPHQQQPHQHHLPIIPKKNNMWPYPPFLNFNILRFFCFLFFFSQPVLIPWQSRYIVILPAGRKAFRHLYGLAAPVAVVTTLGFTAFTAPSEDYHAGRLAVRVTR